MVKVDYSYYTTEYGGVAIPEDRFKFVLKKAIYLLSYYTLGRVESVEDDDSVLASKIKDCLCEMCDKLYAYSQDNNIVGGIKTSETVGKWSVSFDSSTLPKSIEQSVYKTVDTYLGNTYLCCRWL